MTPRPKLAWLVACCLASFVGMAPCVAWRPHQAWGPASAAAQGTNIVL
ncbi:MAG: hypothetical protein FD129_337, partial [bacterium]